MNNFTIDVHAAVSAFFRQIDLNSLFRVSKDNHEVKQLKRTFTGRHATGRLLRAQAKRVKAGKRPYFPEKLVL